ncbi:SDR family NAD(P)-dependent oxidoreductase [Glaciecola siphonariae]|uniref:SDR family NAD(P)-dependent oxidoreductase n=1 Tax=Glaciecola siphonariae TaxID=521012 RepID=A0ABV9LZF1_9ALTE
MECNGRWALITGAAGGIGKALVEEFVDEGYKVISADIVFAESKFVGENVYELQLDLAQIVDNANALGSLKEQIANITGGEGIAVLVNNAAVQILSSTQDMTIDQWNMTWTINLHAPFLLIQTFLEDLSKNKGAVVNISSIHAKQTKKRFVAYATSKAALSSLTRNLAVDLGDKIRINAIEPAAVGTDMLLAGFIESPEQLASLNEFHPLGRIANPKEIAELAVFLCSEKSRFIQGASISATGGIDGCLSDPG